MENNPAGDEGYLQKGGVRIENPIYEEISR